MTADFPLLPALFREALVRAGMPATDDWWAGLDLPSRSEALHLWQTCEENETGIGIRVEGHFTDEEKEVSADFWHNDFYDYLIGHEVYLRDPPKFHVCTRHPVAAKAVRAGRIPHDFDCPFASAECPMHRVLSLRPEKSLKLKVTLQQQT